MNNPKKSGLLENLEKIKSEYDKLNNNLIEIRYFLDKKRTEEALKDLHSKRSPIEKLIGWFDSNPGYPLTIVVNDGKPMRYQ